MKKAAKVFLIYKIVVSIGYILLMSFLLVMSILNMTKGIKAELWFGEISWWFLIASQITGIIVGTIALSICSHAMKVLKIARSKEEIKSTAIWTLLFGQVIAGIIMLCMKDDDLVIPIFH